MDIKFYMKEDGTEPAREFLDSLAPKKLAKMLRTIDFGLVEDGAEPAEAQTEEK